jgi:hypothetical protein
MSCARFLQQAQKPCSRRRMKIALILPRAGIYRYGTGAFSRFIRYSPMTLPTLAALVPADIEAQIEMYDEGPFVLDDGPVAVCGYCPTAILKNDKLVRCCEIYHMDE